MSLQGQDYAVMMADPDAPLGSGQLPAMQDRVRIGHTRTKSLSRQTATVDDGTDEDAPYASNEPGEKSRSIEGAGLTVFDDEGQQMAEYWEEHQNEHGQPWLFFVPVERDAGGNWVARDGAPTYGQQATITQLDLEGERNSRFEYTLSADFSGPLLREPKLERPPIPSQAGS